MRDRLKRSPAMVIALIALFVALGSGYAIGAGFIGTGDLKNQAVTNKKIKKKTIKANRVKDDTLTGQHPAGSYVLNSKAVLARGVSQDPVQCFLSAAGDQDRALEAVNATNNT